MGIIRKTMSMGTAGLVDFRSDKERIARNTKQTKKSVQEQTKIQTELAAAQARAAAEQAAAAVAAQQFYANQARAQQVPAQTSTGAHPGWFYAQGDPPGTERLWDGSQWTSSTRQAG